jgi:3',5'-cyclic AMP phosphodiesterase CpdA
MSALRIAHISDLHCGSPHFQAELLERAIEEINELRPEVTVISGDLTADGFKGEYQDAREFVDRIECPQLIVVPGNHDSRNVGYVHFEDLFGPRHSELHANGISIVAEDSSEPDLDHGQIGRNRYATIEEQFSRPADLRIFVLHHHLLPIPGTGRERNIVYDAGDLLEVLMRAGVNLVLAGHKHVPYAWRLEDLFVVTTGTVSTLRLRGHTRPCYNVVEIDRDAVRIVRRYPFDGEEPIIEWSRDTPHEYEKAGLYGEEVGR